MDEAELKRQRWLKVIVIGLGLLILLLLGAVVTTILMRGNKAADRKVAASHTAVTSAGQSADFGDVKVTLPAGAHLEGMRIDQGRLMVDLTLPSGAMQILVFDTGTGQKLGSFEFTPQ